MLMKGNMEDDMQPVEVEGTTAQMSITSEGTPGSRDWKRSWTGNSSALASFATSEWSLGDATSMADRQPYDCSSFRTDDNEFQPLHEQDEEHGHHNSSPNRSNLGSKDSKLGGMHLRAL
jgi:hypothetical protein